jgi:hypothetical protein
VVSWLRRLLPGTRLQKSQRVYFVTLNGRRFKRIVQPDSYTAHVIAENLTRFGDTDRVPGLVIEYEREIWVDFVEGHRPGPVDEKLARAVADFFAELYAREARLVPADRTPFPARLRRNLRFLHGVGVLDAALAADLQAAVLGCAPDRVWVGFDYTDAVLKNFIAAADDGRICAVDVESLAADELIGVGFAKASERWLGPHRDAFLDQLFRPGVPDFRPYLPFVELHFLAHWTQRAFMERKWRFVDAARFERFRGLA